MGVKNSQRGLCDSFSSQTSFVYCPHSLWVGSPLSSRSHSRTSEQGGGGKGSSASDTGVLQPPFSGSQEKRNLAPGNRSFYPEQVYKDRIFQNGNRFLYPGFHPTFSLGCFFRPFGRIFPRPYPPQVSEIPSVFLARSGFPIPGSPVWNCHGSQSFHQTHGYRGSPSTPSRFGSPSILRRLASSSAVSSTPPVGSGRQLDRDFISGLTAQSRQIRSDSIPRLYVRGHEFSHGRRQSQSPLATCTEVSPAGSNFLQPDKGQGQRVSLPPRGSKLCGRSGYSRTPSPASHTVLSTVSMETSQGQSHRLGSCPSLCASAPQLVVRSLSATGGGSYNTSLAEPPTHIGCQPVRLGGSPRTSWSHGFRVLVSTGISSPHQQFGDASSSAEPKSVQRPSSTSLCPAVYGQYHSSVVCEETRGYSLPLSVSGDSTSVRAVSRTSGLTIGQTHSRTPERSGGWSFSTPSTAPLRMVSSSRSCQSDLPGTGPTDGGPVCHEAQPSPSTLRVSCSGSRSMGTRCSNSGLAPSSGICFSSVQPHSTDSAEGSNFRLSDSLGCPLVAPEILVQRRSCSPQGSTTRTSSSARPPVSARRPSQHSRHVPTTRLAIIRQALRKKRFSSRASLLIASARRQSTRTVYEAKWRVFSEWCARRKIDPLDPSPRRLADFFVFLFDTKKLSVSTIKGYRSMISHTLSFRKKSSACSDPIISELIRALELKRPVSRSLTPKWDLSCVLWSLTKAPYEPISQASLLHVTWKTVFLLTLASAKRRSEIHALSVEDGHLRFNASDGSVTLLCQPGFLSKTQLPSIAPSPFTIPSLARSCGSEDEDRLLCPVRALKAYLQRVKPFRGRRKRLFVPVKGGAEVSASSISRWIASTIKKAYSSLSSADLAFLQIKAHELRALSSSWAYVNHAPLEDILQATFWRNPTTFSSFYLRSFSCQQDNLYLLGPLVVAQSVISSSSSSYPPASGV